MGGIGHKLPLLLPGRFYRFHRPVGKKNAQCQKPGDADDADPEKALKQILQRVLLAADVGEQVAAVGAAVVAQKIPLQDACLPLGTGGLPVNVLQQLLVLTLVAR